MTEHPKHSASSYRGPLPTPEVVRHRAILAKLIATIGRFSGVQVAQILNVSPATITNYLAAPTSTDADATPSFPLDLPPGLTAAEVIEESRALTRTERDDLRREYAPGTPQGDDPQTRAWIDALPD